MLGGFGNRPLLKGRNLDSGVRTDLAAKTSGAALVGLDATLNYAAGTIGQAINDLALNVKQYPWLAKGDGVTDDTAAIQAAIDYLEGVGGGTLFFPRGTYITSAALTIDNHGVMLVGAGEGHPYSTLSAVTTATPTTVIKATAAAPIIHFTCTAGQYKKVGGGVQRMFLHGGDTAGVATYGILVTSRDKLTVSNVVIFNTTLAQVRTQCYTGALASPTSGYDVQHCRFENVVGAYDTANTTCNGLVLTGGQGNGGAGQGNTSFNVFVNTRWVSGTTKDCVVLGDTDNNSFFGLRANGGGTESPITIGAVTFQSAEQTGTGAARYNNIYGLEAVGGVLAKAGTGGQTSSFRNSVFGYNISNGGVRPKIETGAGGSANATLVLHGSEYLYAPPEIEMPSTGSIDFEARSATLADARTITYNKLDIVETGNLDGASLVIEGTSTAGVGTYSVQSGYYSLVGNICFVVFQITWSAHTGTGNMRIKGFPFTAVASNRPAVLHVSAANLTFTGQLSAHMENGTKSALLVSTSNGAALGSVAMDTDATIYVSGCYRLT